MIDDLIAIAEGYLARLVEDLESLKKTNSRESAAWTAGEIRRIRKLLKRAGAA